MGVIIYHMVGLVNGVPEFFKFLLVLVLFNLTAASICLCIGILFKEIGVASLLSSLVMLFSMLFGGLLLNKGDLYREINLFYLFILYTSIIFIFLTYIFIFRFYS